MVAKSKLHSLVTGLCTLMCALALTSSQAAAQTGATTSLQEGWYKIIAGGQHTGFMALRVELDKSTNRFVSTSYTQTNALGGNLRESLVATADAELLPISYQYTSQVGNQTRQIDAVFSSQPMPNATKAAKGNPKFGKAKGPSKPLVVQTLTAKVRNGEQTETLQTKLEPGTFLSQFLVYVMLQSPKGLSAGNKFVFNSVLEESGKVQSGEAFVSGIEKYRGIDAFKILVTFKDPGPDRSKDQKYINYVTTQGLILMTKAPAMALSVEMVSTQEEATKNFDVNQKTLALLFKTMPKSPIQEAPAPKASTTDINNPPNQADPSKPGPKEPVNPLPAGVAPPPGKGN